MGIVDWIVNFLNSPSVARAVAFAMFTSMVFTHWVKYLLPGVLSDHQHRSTTMLTATVVAFTFCSLLWPAKAPGEIPVGIIVGFASPFTYKVIMGILYHFFPWLEPIFSARPKK